MQHSLSFGGPSENPAYQPEVMKVYTKKMNKTSYLLATFNEPLTEDV